MRSSQAINELEQYRQFADAVNVPILANITEFGQTPPFNCEELAGQGVGMVLYPLSAFRAMSKAALDVYQTIAINGDQKAVVDKMQTRMELYEVLGYHAYEKNLTHSSTQKRPSILHFAKSSNEAADKAKNKAKD